MGTKETRLTGKPVSLNLSVPGGVANYSFLAAFFFIMGFFG